LCLVHCTEGQGFAVCAYGIVLKTRVWQFVPRVWQFVPRANNDGQALAVGA
jgi:hypothetical protein